MGVHSIPAKCRNNNFLESSTDVGGKYTSICWLSDWHFQEVTVRLLCISRMSKWDTTVLTGRKPLSTYCCCPDSDKLWQMLIYGSYWSLCIKKNRFNSQYRGIYKWNKWLGGEGRQREVSQEVMRFSNLILRWLNYSLYTSFTPSLNLYSSWMGPQALEPSLSGSISAKPTPLADLPGSL